MQQKFLHSRAPKEVWDSLLESNEKFVENAIYVQQRAVVQSAQKPPVIILSCSDSRVPPELIFDKELGSLFVVRVAGEVVDDVVIDSIEFAVSNFESRVIVILGHSDCGAVAGALQHLQKNGGKTDTARGHLNAVLIPIETAIIQASIDIHNPRALQESIQANIKHVANQLIFRSHTISNALDKEQLIIVGAEYFLDTGKVDQLFIISHDLRDQS